jgi:N-acetylglucosaminyltransferase
MDLPIYLFIFVIFLNRYVFGFYAKTLRAKLLAKRDWDFQPTVAVVVPLFNQGPSIMNTIDSLAAFDYPVEKLTIVIVDDCSTDSSYQDAVTAASKYPNVTVRRNLVNMGKRKGIAAAVRDCDAEIIVSVDSDVIVERDALRLLLCQFTAPDIAAVGGRVHVSNPNHNWLTKLQTIKYYFGQEHIKNIEVAAQQVMCLSGCLTAYRRHVLIELEPVVENRNVFGVAIKYGEDRFLTRQIVKAGYRTVFTKEAACYTEAVTNLPGYFNQQLRWKRSNIIDFALGIRHAHKLSPLVCLSYVSALMMLLVYPFILLRHWQDGQILPLAMTHLALSAFFGCIYYFAKSTRALPRHMRVHPLAFLPMAVMMPVAYLVLTPLALFTLHSSSWETRGHTAVVNAATSQP